MVAFGIAQQPSQLIKTDLWTGYRDLINRVAAMEKAMAEHLNLPRAPVNRLAAQIRASWSDSSSLFAIWQRKLRSHKGSGSACSRNLHTHPQSSPGSLSMYVSQVLRKELETLPHLVRRSRDIISDLAGFTANDGDMMIKFDLKDFFYES